jgi:hypothetical protein
MVQPWRWLALHVMRRSDNGLKYVKLPSRMAVRSPALEVSFLDSSHNELHDATFCRRHGRHSCHYELRSCLYLEFYLHSHTASAFKRDPVTTSPKYVSRRGVLSIKLAGGGQVVRSSIRRDIYNYLLREG